MFFFFFFFFFTRGYTEAQLCLIAPWHLRYFQLARSYHGICAIIYSERPCFAYLPSPSSSSWSVIFFYRLMAVEEELRREQRKMSDTLTHKQRVIEAQEHRIAALDATNNRLLAALAQLKKDHYPGPGGDTLSPPNQRLLSSLTELQSSSCWTIIIRCVHILSLSFFITFSFLSYVKKKIRCSRISISSIESMSRPFKLSLMKCDAVRKQIYLQLYFHGT